MRQILCAGLASLLLLVAPASLAHDVAEPLGAAEALPVVGALVPHCLPLQDDAERGGDAGNGRGFAVRLDDDGTYEGCGDAVDDRDWYAIPTRAGDMVRITVTELDCSRIRLDLHNEAEDTNVFYGSSDRADCGQEIVGFSSAAEDTVYQVVVRTSPERHGGHYTLKVERGPHLVGACGDPQDDGGSGTDASDEAVVTLPGAISTTGCLDEFDGYDWFAVEANAGDRVQAVITPATCGAYDMLMGGAHSGFDDDYSRDVDRCDPYSTSVRMVEDGVVFVGLLSFAHGTTYTLDVTITPSGN